MIVTPTRYTDILLSKVLLGVGISLVMGIITLILNDAFGTQVALLIGSLILAAIAAAEFGILLGVLTEDINTLFAVVKSLALVLYAPAIVELIPQIPGWIGQLFPTYYMMSPIIEISQQNAAFDDIAPQLSVLVVMIVLLFGAVMWLGRRQETGGKLISG